MDLSFLIRKYECKYGLKSGVPRLDGHVTVDVFSGEYCGIIQTVVTYIPESIFHMASAEEWGKEARKVLNTMGEIGRDIFS